jgi:hypothetical protein
VLGRYEFILKKSIRQGKLRPLRDPDEPDELAWIPTEGKLANKLTDLITMLYYIMMLGFDFTPRSAWVPG